MDKRLKDPGLLINDKTQLMAKKESTPIYAEWLVQISKDKDTGKPTFEKMKIKRPAVKITEEEAETLNRGVLEGPNTFASMYFPAEVKAAEVGDPGEGAAANPAKKRGSKTAE